MSTARNLADLYKGVIGSRKNVVVENMNDSCLRLAVNHEIYPWHVHPNSDELFVMVEGELTVEFLDRPSVTLRPDDTLLVKMGVVHRTCPNGRAVNLCFEKKEIKTQFVEKSE